MEVVVDAGQRKKTNCQGANHPADKDRATQRLRSFLVAEESGVREDGLQQGPRAADVARKAVELLRSPARRWSC